MIPTPETFSMPTLATFKMPADTPLVIRSAAADQQTAYIMSGEMFQDGRARVVVSTRVPRADAAEITAMLERTHTEREALLAKIEAVREFVDEHSVKMSGSWLID